MKAAAVQVLVVTEDSNLAQSLMRWLGVQPGLVSCGRATSLSLLAGIVEGTSGAVVLIDLSPLGPDRVVALRAIKALADGCLWPRVVVLTSSPNVRDVYEAIDAGACGYVLKDEPPCEVARVITRVAAGEVAFSAATLELLLLDTAARHAPHAPHGGHPSELG